MHLLVLLLQHLLGALLNKPQLQPEPVRRRAPQESGEDRTGCYGESPCLGLQLTAIGWLTVLFGSAAFAFVPSPTVPFVLAPLPPPPQFLSPSRRTLPLSTRLRT